MIDENGTPLRHEGIIHDITTRKILEKQRETSEDLLIKEIEFSQNLIDSADAAIYLKDDQGRLLMVNRRVAEMFKVSKEEIIGETDFDFIPKENADEIRDYDRQVAEAGRPMSFNVTVSFNDGPRTFLDYKFPVSDIEGFPRAVGGIAIEVTKTE